MENGQAVPQVVLMQVRPGDEQGRRLRRALAFLVGMEGPAGKTLPGGVFVAVMDFLTAPWNTLGKTPTTPWGKGEQAKRSEIGAW